MKRIFAWSVVLVLISVSMMCNAMSPEQREVFDGGKAAFAACVHMQGVHVLQNGKVVCLRGKIDPSMFINLVKLRGDIAPRPYVIVSGFGGYENSAIYIVRLLEPFSPVAVVGDACASACAQFLFLMGKQRVMLDCADVAIHGGTESIGQILARNADDSFKENMISAKWRFEKFYSDRGISMDMVDKPPADVQKKLDAGQIVFWPWTINQLRAFGVKGIISETNPEDVGPKDYANVCIKPLSAAGKGAGA